MENMNIRGIIKIRELDPETGEELNEHLVENAVVIDGFEFVAQAILDGGVTDDWNWLAIGNDGTEPVETDTSIGTHEESANVSGLKSIETYDGGDTVVQFGPVTFDSDPEKSNSVEEVVIQDQEDVDGTETIFNRATFSAVDLSDRDLEITVYIDVGDRGFTA